MAGFVGIRILPNAFNVFPQEEWASFALATRFLGRHGAAMPPVTEGSAPDRCLANLRTLIYALESGRREDADRARTAWRDLDTLPASLAIGCLTEILSALRNNHSAEKADEHYPMLDLIDSYSAECLSLARRFVRDGVEAEYFHAGRRRDEGTSLAFDIIRRCGDRSDMHRLRELGRGSHPFAAPALGTLKALHTLLQPE